jgi:hypothetical protein
VAGVQSPEADVRSMEGFERRREIRSHLGHSTGWKWSQRQLSGQIARRSVEGHERAVTLNAVVVGGDEMGMISSSDALPE